MKRLPSVLGAFFLFIQFATAQAITERIDTAAVSKIKTEGMKNSQVMDILSYLTDVYGPRLTWSPEYRKAADWASMKLKEWGLQNIYYDTWAPVGKGWTLKEFSLHMTQPGTQPLIAYPKAWSPGVKEKEAEVVYLDVSRLEDFENYKGKLKGKYVLLNDIVPVRAHFTPEGVRTADSTLLRMANADLQGAGRGRRGRMMFPRITMENFDSVLAFARQFNPNADSASIARMVTEQQVTPRKLEFVQKEGALAALTAGRGDGGTIFVQGATVPQSAETPFMQRMSPYDPKSPAIIPQVAIAAEHYNRLLRSLQRGEKVSLKMKFEVAWTKPDSGFNVIAEIPGTDLKDEVVMVGAHFDSWHAGTGATDDATGSAACMEAVRILRKIAQEHGLKTRRTVRIGLWGGEEQGLLGSREYVSEFLGKSQADVISQMPGAGGGGISAKPGFEKFSVYFNHDNGTGRLRGVYMQGNEAARPVFRSWLTNFNDPKAQTLTIQNTSGTDHLSFDAIGLPGFQFIQDPVEYETRTHHSNMDVYDRVQEEDMKQAATMIAVFTYNAANRDAKFPRKPMPGARPQNVPGGN